MIKKAKRVPEEVEYFIWGGDANDLPDWGVFDFDEDGNLHVKQRLLTEVNINDVVIKTSDGYVDVIPHDLFEELFIRIVFC